MMKKIFKNIGYFFESLFWLFIAFPFLIWKVFGFKFAICFIWEVFYKTITGKPLK
jgi:hypothetical protein